MNNKIKMEIAAIMRQFPLKYPALKHKTNSELFKVIINEMYNFGFIVNIKTVQNKKIKVKNKVRYFYSYYVIINFNIIKNFKTVNAARNRMFKEYIKVKNNEKSKDPI